MSDVIEVSGLNKLYKDFSLNDVHFTLPEGCIAGFIGINGDVAVPFIFEHVISADGDTAFVKIDGKYGILDVRATARS